MSVIIDSTTYFNGPLYTNKLYSTNIITIINDSKYVGIITTNTSCINLTTQNISFFRNINISSNSTKINVPIDYLTNISSTQNISMNNTGIIRNNNISTTLGYTYSVINEASTNTTAYFPFLGAYSSLPSRFGTISIGNIEISRITVKNTGMYLIYITIPIFLDVLTSTSLFNFNSEIRINNITYITYNEMIDIKCFRVNSGEYSNNGIFYNKIFICNITSENSYISMIYKPNTSGIFFFAVYNTLPDTTYGYGDANIRYNIIKIS